MLMAFYIGYIIKKMYLYEEDRIYFTSRKNELIEKNQVDLKSDTQSTMFIELFKYKKKHNDQDH